MIKIKNIFKKLHFLMTGNHVNLKTFIYMSVNDKIIPRYTYSSGVYCLYNIL